LVVQVRVDGSRICDYDPREAERKAFEQDAISNSVYEAYQVFIRTFEFEAHSKKVQRRSDLIA
jgi:hypothetical protein